MKFRLPINNTYIISSSFGVKRDFVINGKRYQDTHDGIDFINKDNVDTRVYAVGEGVVILAEWDNTTGYYVIIQHQEDNEIIGFSKYCHLGFLNVKKNDFVNVNTVLGNYALVGLTTGLHVHISFYTPMWVAIDLMNIFDINFQNECSEKSTDEVGNLL